MRAYTRPDLLGRECIVVEHAGGRMTKQGPADYTVNFGDVRGLVSHDQLLPIGHNPDAETRKEAREVAA